MDAPPDGRCVVSATYHGLPVVWGGNEQGTREHAFVERPGFEWRTFKPRAICGNAWSNEFPPIPNSSVPRCLTCTRVVERRAES